MGECPGIGAPLLREAAEIAARGHLVIGPTAEGGYYLIGGMLSLPDVFNRHAMEQRPPARRNAHAACTPGVVWRETRPLTIVETVEHARAERLLT
jgi:glycosyltransferase A (GT-A) superfamily protein (DUF2064 family)